MGLRLIKGGMTTVDIAARQYPIQEPIEPNQIIGIAEGGKVKVADYSGSAAGDVQYWIVTIVDATLTDRTNLKAWFSDPLIRYFRFTFTFEIEDTTQYTVRYWGSNLFDIPQTHHGIALVELRFREEV